jgi:hypothetical protein
MSGRMKSRKICSSSVRAFLVMVDSACPQQLKPERVGALGGTAEDVPFPFLPSLHSKSRSVLGIERLHVNADVELVSSTAQD